MRVMHHIAAGALVLATSSIVHAGDKKPQMSTLELQAIQSHDFEAAKDDTFGAVMTVLQDAGYRIQAGDVQTGLITGVGSSQGKLTYNLIWGFGKKKLTPMVSAFIEKIGAGSRVRLNFVMAKLKSNLYGSQPEDEEPVLDATVYKDAFEKVEQALFVRQAMTTTAPPQTAVVAPTPASVAPTAAPSTVTH